MGNLDHTLQAVTPRDLDNRLAWQARSFGCALQARHRTLFPSGPNGERLPSVDVIAECEVSGKPDQIAAFAARIERALQPADRRLVEEWLVALSVKVPMRQGDDATNALRLHVYADHLQTYPADVARAALLDHRWRFWPSWAELAEVCDRMSSGRKAMLAACRAAAAKPQAQPPRRGERVSAQRAAEIMAEMGFTAERTRAVARRPSARSVDEAVQPVAPAKPHWTETVDPDGPEMQALRRSRQAAMERQRPISPAKPTERTE